MADFHTPECRRRHADLGDCPDIARTRSHRRPGTGRGPGATVQSLARPLLL